MKDLQLIVTSDGSHSLLNTTLQETYHSVHGAIQESRHVFLEQGLYFFFNTTKKERANILEIGFGTGLNAILTLVCAQQQKKTIHYTTLESNPLDWETVAQLNYPQLLNPAESRPFFESIHRCAWNCPHEIVKEFLLEKIHYTLQQVSLGTEKYDLIYFDAFAPGKQPEMWTMPALEKVTKAMKPGAVFVTYCAKGQLKRDLKSLDLLVETLPGPPGKKEMVRALKK